MHFVEEDTGAVTPAIQLAGTYARDENYEARKPYWYRRDGSQTTSHAEAVIAEIEGAADTLLFSSGLHGSDRTFGYGCACCCSKSYVSWRIEPVSKIRDQEAS